MLGLPMVNWQGTGAAKGKRPARLTRLPIAKAHPVISIGGVNRVPARFTTSHRITVWPEMNPYTKPDSAADEPFDRAKSKPHLPPGFMLMAGVGIVVLNLLWASVTMCMCSHTDTKTTAVLMPSFVSMIALAVVGRNNQVWERIPNYAFLMILTIMTAKNIADVLWHGHSPLLR
jgi:hypothetical protein